MGKVVHIFFRARFARFRARFAQFRARFAQHPGTTKWQNQSESSSPGKIFYRANGHKVSLNSRSNFTMVSCHESGTLVFGWCHK